MNGIQLFCAVALGLLGLVLIFSSLKGDKKPHGRNLEPHGKEPTYRIREWYGDNGPSYMPNRRMWYTPEVKTRWGWEAVGSAQVDREDAEWSLRNYIQRKAEADREKVTTYYTREGRRHE